MGDATWSRRGADSRSVAEAGTEGEDRVAALLAKNPAGRDGEPDAAEESDQGREEGKG